MAPQKQQHKVKVLELSRVSPAPGSTAPASLPLTFFDLLFLRFHPVQRLFFYELPHSKSHFLDTQLPELKRSLALALRDFRPLAGNLLAISSKPELRYSDGDAVEFTVAECDDDFDDLAGNHARDATRFHSLVPPLLAWGAEVPVLALQVTVFPNAGIGIGISINHAVSDGSTSAHFLKSWAAFCRLGRRKGCKSFAGAALPYYDRSVIRDPKGLERIFLDDLDTLKDDRRMEAWDLHTRPDVVRSTFVLCRIQIEKLGQRVFDTTLSSDCSPYSLAAGFIWTCLVKARGDGSNKKEFFGFVTGCRARLVPPTPATYFGNCLGICRVEAMRSDLVGEDGAIIASKTIWKVIRGLEGGGAFRGAENWIRDMFHLASMGVLTVAGSPKLGLYEVDFGWGRPRKVEVISIERTSAMSIAECREEQGGLEFGLALPKDDMERFTSLFADGVKLLR